MKNLLFVLLVIQFIYSCDEPKKKASFKISKDSLYIYIDNGKNLSFDDSSRERFNLRALQILEGEKSDTLNKERLFDIANNFFSNKDWKNFKKASNIILLKAMRDKDTINIAKGFRYKAEYYKNVEIIDSAFIFYLKAEKLYTKLNDKFSLGKIYLKKGILQFYANDYFGADISISQAYNLLKNSDDKETVYKAVSMIGIIANEMKDYDRALEKHNEALDIVREYKLSGRENQEATTLNNIGNVYQNLNKNQEAINNFNRALADKKLVKETPDLYAILIDNLAYSKFKMQDYNDLPTLFFKSLYIRDSLNMSSGVVLSEIHLSEYFASTGDTIDSQKHAQNAIITAKKSKTPSDILASLKQLSLINHKKSSIYTKEYIRINDSLQQAERKSKNNFTRIQFETNEILQEKDQLAVQNRNLLYFFIGTLMIGMLLFVIRTQRAKNRELLLKQAQQKANEEIYNLMISQQNSIEESRIKEKKRIAQELHDGVLGRLFGARLNLDSLNKVATDEAANKRNDYLSELKNIEQDIREISHDLNREKYVLINNFVAILNNLLEEQKALFVPKLAVNIDENIKWENVKNTAKINLYRIIQESLQNINKYATATIVKLEIKRNGENLVLNVTDNGAGFTVNTKKKGIGLENMISRTHELNGTFDIRSKKGKGTTINVIFPIEDKE